MPRKNTRNPVGSIFKRQVEKDGKVITVYDVRKRVPKLDAAGEQLYGSTGQKLYRTKSQRCYSYPEALVALGNLPGRIAADDRARPAVGRRHTFGELVDEFRAKHVKRAVIVRGEKVAGYKKNITHIETILTEAMRFFGNVSIEEITFDRLREYKEHLQTTPTARGSMPAVSTVNEKLSFIRRMFTIAFEKNWIAVSPFQKGKGLIRRSRTRKRNRMLTFEEEHRLLAQCIDEERPKPYERNGKTIRAVHLIRRAYLRPIIIFALDTAMRLSEIRRVEWRQVDFVNDVIYLEDEDAQKTKTGEPGILPMTERLKDELLRLRESLPRHPLATDRVFYFGDFKNAFANAKRDAGIASLQFKDFRSTGTTRMLLAGARTPQVMKITRHRTEDVFLGNYTNVDVESARRIGRSMDEFIRDEKAKVPLIG